MMKPSIKLKPFSSDKYFRNSKAISEILPWSSQLLFLTVQLHSQFY